MNIKNCLEAELFFLVIHILIVIRLSCFFYLEAHDHGCIPHTLQKWGGERDIVSRGSDVRGPHLGWRIYLQLHGARHPFLRR